MTVKKKVPKLPALIASKIYKTGQTRGADDSVVYQNRVGRNNTVLIPFTYWDQVHLPPAGENGFEKGFICLISPEEYFGNVQIEGLLNARGLILGINLLVFYTQRSEWMQYPPKPGWVPGNAREAPLGGQYVARVAGTTSSNGSKLFEGYNTTSMKGAGIRLFEYASTKTISDCRIQLESLFWLCSDSIETVVLYGMENADAIERKKYSLELAQSHGLLNYQALYDARMIDPNSSTICPFCLEPLSAKGFFSRFAQAMGREVHDLTITEINLFHIQELRYGVYNHRTYNLGWGHHHCNVVVKDSGIHDTLQWMHGVVEKNINLGFL